MAADAPVGTVRSAAAAAEDRCGGRCSDILPPGQNGHATHAQILLHRSFGTRPPHADDQLGPYARLATGHQSLTDDTINTFFNDASFGVPADQAASTLRPAGRGRLTPFAGGAPANQGLEQQFWRNAPYTEAELQAQIDGAVAGPANAASRPGPTCTPTSTGSTPASTPRTAAATSPASTS
ncbi:hypothetical protein ACLGIH_27545 [Streptomyces sp. HMX87]|uniref:hypothetical protein n=1 Tax=Streptomyces sp. HMX87 TaxID=3390849 RepID=UPI003A89D5FF